MKLIKLCFAVFALSFCYVGVGDARLIAELDYRELFDKSDIIVIARPATKTTDTKEVSYFADIVQTDENGKQRKVKAIGVETIFDVKQVIRGDEGLKRFVLHHYREKSSSISLDGPGVVSFDPSDDKRRRDILLFLVREKDGRYAPYGGQTDPGANSIFALDDPP